MAPDSNLIIWNRSLPCSVLTQTFPQQFNLVKCELYTTFLPRALWDNALKETRQIASHKIHTLQLLILIKFIILFRNDKEIMRFLLDSANGINMIQRKW